MKAIVKLIDRIIDCILVLLMTAVVVVVVLQIIFRFFISKPLSWSEELSRYIFIWISYIGGYLCTRHGTHLGITAFVDRMPAIPKRIVIMIADISLLIYQGIVCYYGVQLCMKVMRQPSAVMRIPMGIVYGAIPVGMFLMLLATLVRFFMKDEVTE